MPRLYSAYQDVTRRPKVGKGIKNMTILWNDNLASGSAEIDNQHKELFQRISGLLEAFERGAPSREEVARIVQYLSDYVVFHFGNEETYMAKYSYSSMSAHKAQHEQFVKNFMKLRDRILREGINTTLAVETKELCVDWLINHIKYSDRALGLYLKLKNAGQNGMSGTPETSRGPSGIR